MTWRTAFVATSAILGEPLGPLPSTCAAEADPAALELARVLASAPRDSRARVLARELAAIAHELDRARLA